jgi:hypothetical protein
MEVGEVNIRKNTKYREDVGLCRTKFMKKRVNAEVGEVNLCKNTKYKEVM